MHNTSLLHMIFVSWLHAHTQRKTFPPSYKINALFLLNEHTDLFILIYILHWMIKVYKCPLLKTNEPKLRHLFFRHLKKKSYSGYQSHKPSNDSFLHCQWVFGGRQSNVSMTTILDRWFYEQFRSQPCSLVVALCFIAALRMYCERNFQNLKWRCVLSVEKWPEEMRRMFWRKPTGDKQTFKIYHEGEVASW